MIKWNTVSQHSMRSFMLLLTLYATLLLLVFSSFDHADHDHQAGTTSSCEDCLVKDKIKEFDQPADRSAHFVAPTMETNKLVDIRSTDTFSFAAQRPRSPPTAS